MDVQVDERRLSHGRSILAPRSDGSRDARAPARLANVASLDERERKLRRAYEAFNAREIDAALGLMHPDVDWPNVLAGGRLRGHDELRRYWTLQFATIDTPTSSPRPSPMTETATWSSRCTRSCGASTGEPLADERVKHVSAPRDGLVERMEIA
jgi:hypothetical protein